MTGHSWLGSKRESVIGPALEKPLLKLHRAMDVKSFWKAVHRLLSASTRITPSACCFSKTQVRL
jgi:hypothetical protein